MISIDKRLAESSFGFQTPADFPYLFWLPLTSILLVQLTYNIILVLSTYHDNMIYIYYEMITTVS